MYMYMLETLIDLRYVSIVVVVCGQVRNELHVHNPLTHQDVCGAIACWSPQCYMFMYMQLKVMKMHVDVKWACMAKLFCVCKLVTQAYYCIARKFGGKLNFWSLAVCLCNCQITIHQY